jgi:hypothetical protein
MYMLELQKGYFLTFYMLGPKEKGQTCGIIKVHRGVHPVSKSHFQLPEVSTFHRFFLKATTEDTSLKMFSKSGHPWCMLACYPSYTGGRDGRTKCFR